jgi:hypothetical protein
MKKLLTILIFGCFIIGCGESPVYIVNDSSKDISYVFSGSHGYETCIIKAHEQKTHSTSQGGMHEIVSYEAKVLPQSIYLENDEFIYTFYDVAPLPINILNNVSRDVVLSADGYLSIDPLTINANAELTTETVCTKNPSFSAKTIDNYPVQVDMIFDGAKFMVSLR